MGFSVKNTLHMLLHVILLCFLSIHEILYSNKMYQCEYVGKCVGGLPNNEITESFLKELEGIDIW